MKRIITALFVVALAVAMYADEVPGIIVQTNSGTTAVPLSDIASIKHADGQMVLNKVEGDEMALKLTDVQKWTLGEVDGEVVEDTTAVDTTHQDPVVWSRYDVNRDGMVNTADVVSVYNYIINGAELTGISSDRADVNEDGAVNTADVVSIYNYIINGEQTTSNIVVSADGDPKALYLLMSNGQRYVAALEQLGEITFSADGLTMCLNYNGKTSEVAVADVVEATYGELIEVVKVTYQEDTTAIVNPYAFDGVTLTTDKAGVVVNSVADSKVEYELDGNSDNGFFKIYSNKKYQVTMKGLILTNPNGPVLNSQSSKEGVIKSLNGFDNILTDGQTYAESTEDQKGCIFSEGQLIFKGAGSLTVNSNKKHGICSDDYISIENSNITVNSASDAIHANDSVMILGGVVTLNPANDGIDCLGPVMIQTADSETAALTIKVTGDDNSAVKSDSLITVQSGTISITTTGAADKCLKSKGNIVYNGGSLTATQSGKKVVEGADISYATALKASGNIDINGGTLDLTNTADGGKGISADGNINIKDGNVTIKANGAGGIAEVDNSGNVDDEPEDTKSYVVYVSVPSSSTGGFNPGGSTSNYWTTMNLYKSDGTLVSTLTAKKTVTATNGQSASFYYYDFKEPTSGTYYFKSADYRSSRGGTYSIVSGTFSGPTSGNDVYYSISSSYSTSSTTRTFSISNVTNTYAGGTTSGGVADETGTAYDAAGLKSDGDITIDGGVIRVNNSGAMSKSIKCDKTVTVNGGTLTLSPSGAMQIINNDPSYSTGIKAKNYVGNGGTLTITPTGIAGRAISTSTSLVINDGKYTITSSSAGQTGTSTSYSAKGLTSDSELKIIGGTLDIKMTGSAGKGIKSDGTIEIGKKENGEESGPILNVSTTGSALGSSSGGGGGPGGWGGNTSSNSASAKAIKAQGTINIYGGEMTVSTSSAEGMESKTSVNIAGGKHYFKCYDDCINSSGNIYFNGGVTVCYSNGNDAVDSNAGRTGAITIGDGVVLAYTSKGSPEEGLDCDNNSYIQITGKGIAISAGGAQGGSSSSSISNAAQGYQFYTSSISYTTGRYYTIADSSGKNLVTYSFEAGLSSNLNLWTATGMTSGSTYTVKYSTTAPTDATTEWHGLYLGSTATGTTSVASFTAK